MAIIMNDRPEIKSNVLYYGDNLIHMQNKYNFPDNSVDLVYLDPPFSPNHLYVADEESSQKEHKEMWKVGIDSYIEYMRPRLQEMYRILSEKGTIYLHCNYVAFPNLKLLMDEIFNIRNYRTTIVWQRHTSLFGQKSNKIFPEVSDYILVYTKTKNFIYNTQYLPYTEEELKETQKGFENPDNDPRGKYIWQYFWNKDEVPSDKSLELNKNSEIKFLSRTKSGTYKYKRYWNDTTEADGKSRKGVGAGNPISNIWTDIYRPKEKRFKTEKPEKLLERIIVSSSNVNDIVFDPFLGSGTTTYVTKKYFRKFIGIDYSMSAILMSAKRLGITEQDIVGMPKISIKSTETIKKINKENIPNKAIAIDIIKATEEFSIKRTKARDENDVHREYIGFLKGRFSDIDFDFKKSLENGKIPDISIKRMIGMEVKRKAHYYSIGAQIFEYEDSFEYLMFVMFDMIGSEQEYENMKSNVRKKHPEIIFIRDGVPS